MFKFQMNLFIVCYSFVSHDLISQEKFIYKKKYHSLISKIISQGFLSFLFSVQGSLFGYYLFNVYLDNLYLNNLY